jgi:hypothetical protein
MKTSCKHRLLTALAVSFAAAAPPAFAQNVDWTPFASREFRFSVSFCGAPTKDEPSTDSKGEITATLNLFKAVSENYMCFVALADYNITPDAEQELKLNQTNFINAIKGTLGTSRRMDFMNRGEKLPALTFTYEMAPNLVGKAIVILRGKRVFMLVFQYNRDQDYAAAVQKFLDSFRIAN